MNEERFSPWQESEDNEKKPVRSRFESVVDFLRQSREKSNDDKEDDDTEKGIRRKKAKSSPWRRFMRGLFGGSEEETAKDTPPSTPRLISFEPIKEAVADADPVKAAESKNQSKSEDKVKDSNLKQQERADVPQPQNEEKTIVTEEYGHSELEYEQTPVRQKPVVEQITPEQSHETHPPDQKHSNPTGLLLGLDYLNYRGRKKLEKKVEEQQKKQNESLNNLKEQLRNQEEIQKQLPEQEKYISSQQTVFEVHQENPAASKEPEVQVIFNHRKTKGNTSERDQDKIKQKKQRTQEELQELIELRKNQEEQRKIAREQSIERERLEQREQDSKSKLSKELLKTESTFVEKEYERRNEVRDQPQRLKPATSVGAVLVGMQAKNYTPSVEKESIKDHATARHTKDIQSRNSQLSDFEIAHMYKYAIRTGFTTAIVLLAVVLSITILR